VSAELGTAYQALVMSGEGRMAVIARDVSALAAGQVRLEIIATGICGSDLHGLAGDTGRREVGQVMGHETVGRIAELGAGVRGHRAGDVVVVNPVVGCGSCTACLSGQSQRCSDGWVLGVRADVDGAFAEQLTVPATALVPLPEGMEPWHGALVEPLAVGYHAVMRGRPDETDRVLVIGGGPIGQAAAIAARRTGVAQTVVSEPDARRAGLLSALGFEVVAPAELDRAVDLLGGRPTLVIDAVGTARTLSEAFRISERGARIVMVGMASPQLDFSAYALSADERTLIGTFCYTPDEFASTVDWLAGEPEVAEALTDRFESLARGNEVFEELLAATELPNKVLLCPDPQALRRR
jgi:threonine dehydrogenase-like Zn-dependent dehydrogenase